MSQLLWIDKISEFLNSWIVDIILSILSFIPKIMYFLVACLLSVIDLFQIVFRKLAGLDPIMIGDEITTGDSVYQLITDALFGNQYPAIQLIFWSLIILGVIMLIVTSLIATIRLEYNPDKEKGNSKSKIIGTFIKALFHFAIIPIGSIFGMYFSNVIVQGVDTIISTSMAEAVDGYQYFDTWDTSDLEDDMVDKVRKSSYISYNIFGINIPTTAEPFSGTVFKASAYSCNRFRINGQGYLVEMNNSETNLGIFDGNKIANSNVAADVIDTAFAINAKIKNAGDGVSLDVDNISKDYYRQGMLKLFGTTKNLKSFSKYNVEMVYYFYDLWTFNFIIAFVAVLVIAKLYANFCLALMARIFELLALFVAAPITIGLMPIDGGGALGRWRKTYIAKYGLVFVMVFGMNITSPILSVMQTIKFFGTPIIDYIMNTIVIVAALNAVNSVISAFSKILFDKASAYDGVSDTASKISGSLKSGLGATKSLAAGTVAGAMIPVKLGARGANALRHRVGLDRAGQERRIQRNFDRQEMKAAKDTVAYDPAKGSNEYKNLDHAERGKLADDFFATEKGKQWVHDYYGDDLKAAKHAIQKEGKKINGSGKLYEMGRKDDGTKDEVQKDILQQFIHDRNNFASTKEAQNLKEGSAEYRSALEAYNKKTEDEKAKDHVGGSALNKQQMDIMEKRQKYAESEEKRAKAWNSVKEGTAKFVKGTEKAVKPVAGALGGMIGMIPGMSLFSSKKDDKK